MKKTFIGLLILVLSAWAQYVFSAEPIQLARMNGYVAAGVGAAASKSCAVDSTLWKDSTATDDFISACGTNARTYVGQGDFDPGENKVVCSISTNIRNVYGSATYIIIIAPMSGDSIGTVGTGCTSDAITIDSSGTKTFTGLNCSLTNGTTYAISIVRSTLNYDETNYLAAGIYVSTTSTALSGHTMEWNSDKTVAQNGYTYDMSYKIYGYTP